MDKCKTWRDLQPTPKQISFLENYTNYDVKRDCITRGQAHDIISDITQNGLLPDNEDDEATYFEDDNDW